MSSLSRTEVWSLLTILGCSIAVLANTFQGDGAPVVASLAFSTLAFSLTFAFVRWSGPAFMKAGLKGRDLGKLHQKEIPESMGSVAAGIYLLVLMAFIPFGFYKDIVSATSGGGNRDVVLTVSQIETGRFLDRFPHSKLSSYQSALNTLQATTILGLADDILDLRWRHKFFIPAIASLPLLVVYYVDFGVTSVVVPNFLIPYMPNNARLLDLSFFYYMYMAAMSIFAPNSINIFAGINGLEVGQSLVIAVLLILNSSLYLVPFVGNPVLSSISSSHAHPHPAAQAHLMALYLLLPFIGVSLALYMHNRFPARVFVGDTYCYVAGMTFAVVGIMGHFSKTLLLLLIPQIFNFVYSTPQLFKIIPCPRHRLPKFNARTGLREPSVTTYTDEKPLRPSLEGVMRLMARLNLVLITTSMDPPTTNSSHAPHSHSTSQSHVYSKSSSTASTSALLGVGTDGANGSTKGGDTEDSNGNVASDKAIRKYGSDRGRITSTTNLTLINLWLVWRGPMREDRLERELLVMQCACGLLGLFVRHKMALWFFGMDNRGQSGSWSLM